MVDKSTTEKLILSTMNSKILDIIDRCGGELMVAYNLALHQQTVKRWVKRGGIPQKYWRRLSELGSIPLEAIKDVHAKAKHRQGKAWAKTDSSRT